MKISLVLLAAAIFTLSVRANEHREHGAHDHGSATLGIAFDGVKGSVDFSGATDGILGFEYEAKSVKDKKALKEAIQNFTVNVGKMIQLDPALGCQFTAGKIGRVPEKEEPSDSKKHHGEHSDFVASFTVVCSKSPEGTSLIVDFSDFSRIKDLDITVLVGAVQKNVEYKKKPVQIELK